MRQSCWRRACGSVFSSIVSRVRTASSTGGTPRSPSSAPTSSRSTPLGLRPAIARAAHRDRGDGPPPPRSRTRLRAGDAEIARETLLHHWLGLVVGARAAEIEQTAIDNVAPYARRRAGAPGACVRKRCARRPSRRARALRRAEAMIARTRRRTEPAVLQIARLFITDERSEVAEASAKVRQMLLDADSTELGDRAALNYLLGWTEIRHRGNPMIRSSTSRPAAREAQSSAIANSRSGPWGISPSARPGRSPRRCEVIAGRGTS